MKCAISSAACSATSDSVSVFCITYKPHIGLTALCSNAGFGPGAVGTGIITIEVARCAGCRKSGTRGIKIFTPK